MENKPYYLGLDIGTDSVGYAAADEAYCLCKFKGEPVWGVTLFDAANPAEERRAMRVARRRLDRRQQRAALLEELFAPEIGAIDPDFFLRRRESALFAEDAAAGVRLFDGGLTDEEYHRRYPTIHHLICELMESAQPHDVRLVYLACAWLVTHRGHFLFDAAEGAVDDFGVAYAKLCDHFELGCECPLPWDTDVSADTLLEIMTARAGVKRKQMMFTELIYGGKKPPKKRDEDFPYSRDGIVSLLCGGKAAPKDVFDNAEYAEIESVSLGMDEENFARILSELGEDGELLRVLRGIYDCALLTQTLDGCRYISEAKVKVYEQHGRDLAYLKRIVKKYAPAKYDLIFRAEGKDNYVAYSGNAKSCKAPESVKHVKKESLCNFLLKNLKELPVEETDRAEYEDMLERLRQYTFLPKQRDSDNRVIPQQLYYAELDCILQNAAAYLPMLGRCDESGLSGADRIRAIFRFRIPYYVGPLNRAAENSWAVREKGKIYPWNFDQMVDLDASEQAFIQRMINHCTYLPGEEVLPQNSLLYSRYMVLNEINNLTVNGRSIPVSVKQELVTELFEKSSRKVTPKAIHEFLRSRGCMEPNDELGGIDVTIKASLKSYHSFRRLLESGTLTENEVEDIIRHAAYSEDKSRMSRWLGRKYPQLSPEDRRYILRLNLKEFGRLSARLLTGLYHAEPETGEALSIMDMLWQTNENLMQLLSARYTFREQIDAFAADYYAEHPRTLSERLDEMYISNAVKRPIVRTLKVTEEVVKAMGRPPEKIFVEMARDSGGEQRGKRTVSRRQKILDLYKTIKTDEARALEAEIAAMGDMADNRLQGDKLFLYYMQLGRCMYTGEPIELSQLATKAYDIDHIYPQSKVQDDSVLNNKVLCLSSANGAKTDRYPIDASIREKMRPWWEFLLKNKLIEKEKFNRLTRATGFTDEELHGFINRQLVETRQSTKAVAQLLGERYPETQIVYVKAGLVSRFRQEYEIFKSRAVNDLHHAKDAYLNIVVGNVYHERFTKRWFDVRQDYSLNIRALFGRPVTAGGKTVWHGEEDVAAVKKTAAKNAVHLTRYAFCRKGGLFDQLPVKAGSGLVPRKANLPTERYGGYNKTTASYYMLVSYTIKGKKDIMFVPIELLYADKIAADEAFARDYITRTISNINGGKSVENVELLLGGRKIRINTVIEADGMRMVLKGKANGGAVIIVSPSVPLVLGASMERYVKRLEALAQKRREGAAILPDEKHDHITREENLALYDTLCGKLTDTVFAKCPGNIAATVVNGRDKFVSISTEEQINCLLSIVSWFGSAPSCDLESIGGFKKSGARNPNSRLAAWKKNYSDVRIVDTAASGLFETRSENLLELL
ncbi:MAG: type II CRISPR RNA-guided endonuclease Cas9 [Butyricicoccus sp.]